MARYDYRCRACGDTFEVTRSISAVATQVECPQGHTDTVKLLSTVAITGLGGSAPRPAASGGGGGCCGGSCGCG